MMASMSDYFAKNRYQCKYYLGDRVRGKWNNIPFTGSVAIDTVIEDDAQPIVIVFSDFPILFDGVHYTLIKSKHDDITKLT